MINFLITYGIFLLGVLLGFGVGWSACATREAVLPTVKRRDEWR